MKSYIALSEILKDSDLNILEGKNTGFPGKTSLILYAMRYAGENEYYRVCGHTEGIKISL